MILQSRYDHAELKSRAREVGFASLLTKPVNMSHLFDCIVSALNVDGAVPEPVSAHNILMVEEPRFSGLRVLLAEDNAVNQKVACMHLQKLGCQVETVGDGEQACRALATDAFDIVFMDCQMPVMDGFAAAGKIRESEKRTGKHQLIVAMTANAMKGDRDICLAAGMDDYMTKPVSLEKIAAMIERWSAGPDHGGEGSLQENDENKTGVIQINLNQMRDLFGDDDEAISEILEMFYDSMKRIVVDHMAGALRDRDGEAMYALAHELKGAAANIGGENIAAVCLEIESLSKEQGWDAIRLHLESLKSVLDDVAQLVAGLGVKG